MSKPILRNHKRSAHMKFAQRAVEQQQRAKSDLRVARVHDTRIKLHNAD